MIGIDSVFCFLPLLGDPSTFNSSPGMNNDKQLQTLVVHDNGGTTTLRILEESDLHYPTEKRGWFGTSDHESRRFSIIITYVKSDVK